MLLYRIIWKAHTRRPCFKSTMKYREFLYKFPANSSGELAMNYGSCIYFCGVNELIDQPGFLYQVLGLCRLDVSECPAALRKGFGAKREWQRLKITWNTLVTDKGSAEPKMPKVACNTCHGPTMPHFQSVSTFYIIYDSFSSFRHNSS